MKFKLLHSFIVSSVREKKEAAGCKALLESETDWLGNKAHFIFSNYNMSLQNEK